jgi:hypothetical protein
LVNYYSKLEEDIYKKINLNKETTELKIENEIVEEIINLNKKNELKLMCKKKILKTGKLKVDAIHY